MRDISSSSSASSSSSSEASEKIRRRHKRPRSRARKPGNRSDSSEDHTSNIREIYQKFRKTVRPERRYSRSRSRSPLTQVIRSTSPPKVPMEIDLRNMIQSFSTQLEEIKAQVGLKPEKEFLKKLPGTEASDHMESLDIDDTNEFSEEEKSQNPDRYRDENRATSPTPSTLEGTGEVPFKDLIKEVFSRYDGTVTKPKSTQHRGTSSKIFAPPEETEEIVLAPHTAYAEEWRESLDHTVWGEKRTTPGSWSYPPVEAGIKEQKFFTPWFPRISGFKSHYYATPSFLKPGFKPHFNLDSDASRVQLPSQIPAHFSMPKQALSAMQNLTESICQIGSFQDIAMVSMHGELEKVKSELAIERPDPELVAEHVATIDRILQSMAKALCHQVPLAIRIQANLALTARYSMLKDSKLPEPVKASLYRAPLGTSSKLFSGCCTAAATEATKFREAQAKSGGASFRSPKQFNSTNTRPQSSTSQAGQDQYKKAGWSSNSTSGSSSASSYNAGTGSNNRNYNPRGQNRGRGGRSRRGSRPFRGQSRQ